MGEGLAADTTVGPAYHSTHGFFLARCCLLLIEKGANVSKPRVIHPVDVTWIPAAAKWSSIPTLTSTSASLGSKWRVPAHFDILLNRPVVSKLAKSPGYPDRRRKTRRATVGRPNGHGRWSCQDTMHMPHGRLTPVQLRTSSWMLRLCCIIQCQLRHGSSPNP